MDYDDVAAAFLTPLDEPIAPPEVPTSTARRLRDAVEPIATIGWWARSAGDGFANVGLEFFGGYMWGRAAALGGDVDTSVAISAFGVFEPSLMDGVLISARAIA
ncbi:helix-turn-helix domain-containing protein, partial [Ilumatobacter sp.]|uniref:helix-turn-helix domain-containing protein n=1 Tax=Ilumatobacter sp. TaxID=1967498 RepID=UPI003C6BABA1